VHQRAVALEQRCRHTWHIRAAGGALAPCLPQKYVDAMKRSDGNGFLGFWEAMVRQELNADPTLLSDLG